MKKEGEGGKCGGGGGGGGWGEGLHPNADYHRVIRQLGANSSQAPDASSQIPLVVTFCRLLTPSLPQARIFQIKKKKKKFNAHNAEQSDNMPGSTSATVHIPSSC